LDKSISKLDGASAADKVHDDRYQGEDEQQVNEEAAHVKNEESAKPKQNQNDRQNEKHELPSFLPQVAAGRGMATGHMRYIGADSLLCGLKISSQGLNPKLKGDLVAGGCGFYFSPFCLRSFI
jgi:hypothetical protein